MDSEDTSSGQLIANILAGAGFGLLLGVIVGLSQTPVVMGVITVLTGLLAVFLGLKAKGDAAEPDIAKQQHNNARISGFGIATAFGLVLGMYLRIANPFSEDPSIEAERWGQAFPDNPVLASQAMLFERMGIEPSVWYFDPDAAIVATVDVEQAKARRGGLFGVLQRADLCNELDPELSSEDPEILLSVYDVPDEPVLLAIAAKVSQLPKTEQLSALRGVYFAFCELKDEQAREGRE